MTCKDCIHYGVCWVQQELLDTCEMNEDRECCEDISRYIELPCKVGDTVWAIRSYNPGKKVVVSGKVSEMYYIDEAMTLCIVVKGVCRGVWGVSIFPTQEAAEEYLKKKEKAKNVK